MTNNNDYRYERKFIITDKYFPLEHFIRTLPLPFKEIYYPRIINNVYFDTVQLQSYRENIHGKADRVKLRIRWYDMPNKKNQYKPKLEYKIKKALLGTKKTYPLLPVSDRKQLLNKEAIYENIKASNLPAQVVDDLMIRRPVLINRYKRKYFQSLDSKVRITVDTDIAFCKFSFFENETYLQNHAPNILELKYDKENEELGRKIGQMLPFRLSKFSKYQVGIEKIYSYYAH